MVEIKKDLTFFVHYAMLCLLKGEIMKKYQFLYGTVLLDVHASSLSEAVEIANEDLHLLDELILVPPGRFMRIQMQIGDHPLTAEDVIYVMEL